MVYWEREKGFPVFDEVAYGCRAGYHIGKSRQPYPLVYFGTTVRILVPSWVVCRKRRVGLDFSLGLCSVCLLVVLLVRGVGGIGALVLGR